MRGIELLHPAAQAKANEFTALCRAKGLNVLVTETWRTTAEQDALYSKGRTAPGKIVTQCRGSSYQSPHQWGVAFDFCENVKGKEYANAAFFRNAGSLGKSIGLFWGGDFKSYYDGPHLELPEFLPGNSTKTLIKKYGTPEKFKASWSGQAPSAPVTRKTIRKGSTGSDVIALQSALGVTADGIFGPMTDKAVLAFQNRSGLIADGVAGPKTWAALGL